MNHYIVYANKFGTHEVTAQNRRHAIAAVVARLHLTESQTETVNTWSVTCKELEDAARNVQYQSSLVVAGYGGGRGTVFNR